MATEEAVKNHAEFFLKSFRENPEKPFVAEELEALDYDHPDWERNELNRSYLREVVRQTCERAEHASVLGWTNTDYEIMRNYITHEIAALYGAPNFFVPPMHEN